MNNQRTLIATVIIAAILCLLAVMLLSSFTPNVEGRVAGKGRAGDNSLYLMIVCDGCTESTAVKVSEEVWNSYEGGEEYRGDR